MFEGESADVLDFSVAIVQFDFAVHLRSGAVEFGIVELAAKEVHAASVGVLVVDHRLLLGASGVLESSRFPLRQL